MISSLGIWHGQTKEDVDCGPSQVRIRVTRGGGALPEPYDTKCAITHQDCDAAWDFEPVFPFAMTTAGTKGCHAVKSCFSFFVMMIFFLCFAAICFLTPILNQNPISMHTMTQFARIWPQNSKWS